MNSRPQPTIFYTTLAVAVLSLLLFFVAALNGWFGIAKWGSGAGEFCEAFRPGLIKQPANTWSNLGFVFTGLYIAYTLWQGRYKTNNSITQRAFYGTFFACIVVLLGPGSMAMHATGTDIGGFFDMLSMYLIASFTTAYALERFFHLKPLHFSVIFAVALATCIWANFQTYNIIFGFFGVTVFAFYIAVTISFELLNIYVRRFKHQSKWAFYSFGALVAALVAWVPSQTGAVLCNPQSLLQGHALWHILNALSLYFLFRYYVSEDITPAANRS